MTSTSAGTTASSALRWTAATTIATMNGMGYIVEINPYKPPPPRQAHRPGPLRARKRRLRKPWRASPCRCTWATTHAANTSTSLSPPPCGAPPTPTPPTPGRGRQVPDSGKLYAIQVQCRRHRHMGRSCSDQRGHCRLRTAKFADASRHRHQRPPGRRRGGRHQDGPPRVERREPANGEIYFTLTNNSNRSVNPSGSQYHARRSQPRAYTRHEGLVCPERQPQRHLVRMKEGTSQHLQLGRVPVWR